MTTATSPQNLHPLRNPSEEDDDDRYYNGVSFASTSYLPWFIGSLRVNGFDLSRMGTSGVAVVRGHNYDNVVGAVKRVYKEGPIFRSDWRLPKKPFNRDTFDQMDSGVLRGISVGGIIIWDSLELDNPDETSMDKALFSCDVLLIEESLTPAPADVTSGVDRSVSDALERGGAIFDTIISPVGITTRDTPALLQRLQGMVNDHNETVATLRREEQQTMTNANQIPADVLQRAVADEIARTESLKAIADVPAKLDKLIADTAAEEQRNMEYRARLDSMQFGGAAVLQLGNWKPTDQIIDVGKVMRLTLTSDAGFPELDRQTTSLEESCLERVTLGTPGRNVVARIPWEVLAERGRQIDLQRSALSDGAGLRGLQTDYLGDGGLILNSWSPILARCDVRFGVSGSQKAPWATSQLTALPGAEGSDITATSITLNNVEYLPKSFASAYTISSSLRAADDGMFEEISRRAISDILLDVVTSEVLQGDGGDGFTGIWGKTGVPNHNFGAAPTNFDRDDVVDWLDLVRLAKTDGMRYTMVLGDSMWKLMEKTPRGISGTSSAGYTEISQYLLEMTAPHMGVSEGSMAFHYADFAPGSADLPGLFFKADRCVTWFWGDSLNLELIPLQARGDSFKMVAECNMEMYRPGENASRIKQT